MRILCGALVLFLFLGIDSFMQFIIHPPKTPTQMLLASPLVRAVGMPLTRLGE
ncbi:MAG: hypothetical protein Q9181_001897 [Wetmoreana brouardii]